MDAVLSKSFLTYVYKVLHHPATIGGCDLGDCYNCRDLPPTGLGMWAIGIPAKEIRVMFIAFQQCSFVFWQDLASQKSSLEV